MLDMQQLQTGIGNWITEHGLKILLIFAIAVIVNLVGKKFIKRLVRKMVTPGKNMSAEAEKKREDTLISVFEGTVKVIVVIISSMMILSEIGIDVGPILAAAGVAGLAFGFGGQYLIKDIITGLFIIVENQYRVGDVVCFGDTCGEVEKINLRLTVLRDLDGTVHHIPNGEIKKASNLSKYFARVNLDMGISYDSNLEKVIEVVNRVGNEMAADSFWKDQIIKAPQFVRVENFADSAVVIKILGDTKPLKQWDVTGELRKRLKIAFDREGIEIPFPQMVVHKKSNN